MAKESAARKSRATKVKATDPRVAPPLDRVIHERLRLAILSSLAVADSLSFRDLRTLVEATDGNLSVHARKLEDAGYVECKKSFEGRTPKTEFKLTVSGRSALERYLSHMEALIQAVRDHEK
ncbi:MAG: winged helix-turn-helix domain-containing protein [Planctomycetota bacterium]